jgi:glutathione synthase
MRLLIILDPLPSLRIYKDSSFAMMQAAAARGHHLYVCEPWQLSLRDGQAQACARALQLTGQSDAWYQLGPDRVEPLAAFDAVLMRKDPPFDLEYLYTTFVLERAVQAGARVFNDPTAIRNHNEKLAITEFAQFTTDTLVSRDPQQLRAFVQEHGRAVFKLLDGMGGASIFRVDRDDPNLSVIIETMNQFGARTVMAQRYLPEITQGDKRVLLMGGQVVPYCLARIPKQGETRGNLAAGGTGRAQPLSPRDLEIAQTLAPILWARGLLLVGLDVIGEHLTEINVTSPTCFREIMDQTGFDVAGMFIEALQTAVSAPRPAGGVGLESPGR